MYTNELLSLNALSERVSVKYARLLEWSHSEDFPSIIIGKQKKVWLSDFQAWTIAHFGRDGDMRGSLPAAREEGETKQ